MLTYFHPIYANYVESESPRQLRRSIAKQRAANSTITRREFESRKRARKIANKSRTHNRKFH